VYKRQRGLGDVYKRQPLRFTQTKRRSMRISKT
jgi:hypothetical protein